MHLARAHAPLVKTATRTPKFSVVNQTRRGGKGMPMHACMHATCVRQKYTPLSCFSTTPKAVNAMIVNGTLSLPLLCLQWSGLLKSIPCGDKNGPKKGTESHNTHLPNPFGNPETRPSTRLLLCLTKPRTQNIRP